MYTWICTLLGGWPCGGLYTSDNQCGGCEVWRVWALVLCSCVERGGCSGSRRRSVFTFNSLRSEIKCVCVFARRTRVSCARSALYAICVLRFRKIVRSVLILTSFVSSAISPRSLTDICLYWLLPGGRARLGAAEISSRLTGPRRARHVIPASSHNRTHIRHP